MLFFGEIGSVVFMVEDDDIIFFLFALCMLRKGDSCEQQENNGKE
jgi:hypothetical protein